MRRPEERDTFGVLLLETAHVEYEQPYSVSVMPHRSSDTAQGGTADYVKTVILTGCCYQMDGALQWYAPAQTGPMHSDAQ